MIFVKKWEKRKEMSQKKYNIMYLPYMETKVIFDSLVSKKAQSIETTLRAEKLAEIEQVRLALLSDLAELDNQEEVLDDEKKLEIADTKKNIQIALDGLSSSILLVEESFEKKNRLIRDSYYFDNLQRYSSYFSDFDFHGEYFNALAKKSIVTDLLSSEISQTWDFNKFFKVPTSKSFNINYILYMEEFLRFWWVQTFMYKIFLRDKKLRLRKWRLKKRKLKRLYILKKIKKIMFFKKVRNRNYAVYSYFSHFAKKMISVSNNFLMKKIPLTERVISRNNLEFFYKLNKHTSEDLVLNSTENALKSAYTSIKFKIYLRNFHQKPYWKLRKARIAHWGLFFNKTIRKKRYKNFINKFVKKHTNLSYNYTFFVNFFTRFLVSWTKVSKFESSFKRLLVQKDSKLLKLPIFLNNFFNWKILKKKNYFLKKKIGRWSYLNFKRSQLPWLQRKKNSPKAINHIQPNNQLLNSLGSWDPITSCVYLSKELPLFTFPTKDNFKVNWQIKLHMYRYKSNKTWT